MGFKLRTIVAAVAVAALACTVMAQPTGGGGGGGGRGGQRGFGGGMRNSPFNLIGIKEVQDELKITADEKTKIDALRTDFQAASRKARQDARDSGMSREDSMKAMQQMNDDYLKKLNDLLTTDQQTRFFELRVQRAGNGALLLPDVQKALAFTSKQTDDAKALQDKMQQANMQLFQNQDMSQEDRMKAVTKNNEIMGTELLKLLTDDQAAKFKTMGGKPFTFPKEPPRGGPGGPGGPGGGGPGGGGPGGGGGGG